MQFKYAFQGIIHFFRTEHNAWVHLVSTIAVAVLSFLKGVTETEMIALVMVTGFVWVSELFNTAIEKLSDIISLRYHAQIKAIKDMAAAAVLISAIAALITGMVIFIPKFL